jgi:hypothetical protein
MFPWMILFTLGAATVSDAEQERRKHAPSPRGLLRGQTQVYDIDMGPVTDRIWSPQLRQEHPELFRDMAYAMHGRFPVEVRITGDSPGGFHREFKIKITPGSDRRPSGAREAHARVKFAIAHPDYRYLMDFTDSSLAFSERREQALRARLPDLLSVSPSKPTMLERGAHRYKPERSRVDQQVLLGYADVGFNWFDVGWGKHLTEDSPGRITELSQLWTRIAKLERDVAESGQRNLHRALARIQELHDA